MEQYVQGVVNTLCFCIMHPSDGGMEKWLQDTEEACDDFGYGG